MSDDTPTERFDAPTEPLPEAEGALATPAEASGDEGQKRGMLIALLAIAGAILVALIVLIVVLLGNGGTDDAGPAPEFTTTESPSPTPTETESPEPSDEPSEEPSTEPSATAAPPPPPPPPQSPSFATFNGPNKATCPDTSSSVEITWSWSSSNAVSAWFGIGTQNAKLQPFEQVPTTATYTFNYQCSEASQIYTVTLEDSSGRLTHKTVTVTR